MNPLRVYNISHNIQNFRPIFQIVKHYAQWLQVYCWNGDFAVVFFKRVEGPKKVWDVTTSNPIKTHFESPKRQITNEIFLETHKSNAHTQNDDQ